MDAFLIALGISVFSATTLYFGSSYIVRQPWGRAYIRSHVWLHPNAISYIRIPLGLIVVGLFRAEWYLAALVVLTLAIVSDAVDGVFARYADLGTPLGKTLDPLADKAVYFPLLAYFAYADMLDSSTVIAFLIFDTLSQISRPFLSYLRIDVGANAFGKIKTTMIFLLFYGLFLYRMFPGVVGVDYTRELLIIATVLSVASLAFKCIPKRQYANVFSFLNLFAGMAGIYFVANEQYINAVIAVIIGQIFDLFDGKMARKHGGTPWGPWLDDIADAVSFGVVPGVYIAMGFGKDIFSIGLGMIYTALVFYRLLRFVLVDKKNAKLEAGLFSGLPSPAGAIWMLGICLLHPPFSLLVMAVGASALMVSRVRFYHYRRLTEEILPQEANILVCIAGIILVILSIKNENPDILGYGLVGALGLYLVIASYPVASHIVRKRASYAKKS